MYFREILVLQVLQKGQEAFFSTSTAVERPGCPSSHFRDHLFKAYTGKLIQIDTNIDRFS